MKSIKYLIEFTNTEGEKEVYDAIYDNHECIL